MHDGDAISLRRSVGSLAKGERCWSSCTREGDEQCVCVLRPAFAEVSARRISRDNSGRDWKGPRGPPVTVYTRCHATPHAARGHPRPSQCASCARPCEGTPSARGYCSPTGARVLYRLCQAAKHKPGLAGMARRAAPGTFDFDDASPAATSLLRARRAAGPNANTHTADITPVHTDMPGHAQNHETNFATKKYET